MPKTIFILVLICIAFGGLLLRRYQFDQWPPFRETSDELHYVWAGVSWIKTGIPTSWSWFSSYTNKERLTIGGQEWDMKQPLIEKPPLYFLASGISVIASGSRNTYETRAVIIRRLPVLLSIATIFFTGLLAKEVFSAGTGLLAALLYATSPMAVMSNRLSLTENLLTPIVLCCIWLLVKDRESPNKNLPTIVAISTLSGLAFLTKQAGAALAVAAMSIYYVERKWKKVFLVASGLLLAVSLFFGFAYFYDWSLFWRLHQELQRAHALQGVPEMFFNIFRHLIVIGKDRYFLDGSILLGYLFLFTSPLWLLAKDRQYGSTLSYGKNLVFLAFPFTYLVFILIGESGSTPFTYWGWYAYPFYPFAIVSLASILTALWRLPSFLPILLVCAGLGSSAVRFFFLLQPNYQKNWQIVMVGLVGVFLISWLTARMAMKRLVLLVFIVGVVSINIYTVLNVGKIY